MKFRVLLFMFLPLVAFARPLVVPTLPPSGFADTESSTNVVIDVSDGYLGKFDIRLAANATPSNNVQVAFGIDANEDGELCPAETDLVLGWDSGTWFLKDECADWFQHWPMESGACVLAYSLRIVNLKPRALKVSDGGNALFDAEVPDIPGSLFNPAWNLLRVTSRGKALRDECVFLKLTRFGMMLEIR